MRSSVLQIDVSDIIRLSKRVGELDGITQKSTYRALARAGVTGRKIARQEIKRRVNLQSYYIDKYLELIPASPGKPFFIVRGNYRGTLLTRFSPIPKPGKRKSKRGISVIVKSKQSGGVRKRLPGAFFIRLRSGNVDGNGAMGMAIRDANDKPDVLHGPSTHQVLNQIKEDLIPQMAEVFDYNLERELDFRLKRWTQKR
jgi:hypothetical protein